MVKNQPKQPVFYQKPCSNAILWLNDSNVLLQACEVVISNALYSKQNFNISTAVKAAGGKVDIMAVADEHIPEFHRLAVQQHR